MFRNKSIRKALILIAALTGFASVANATYAPPAARVVKWQGNVGSTAAIPSTGTVVDITKTPYSVPTNGTSDCAPAIKSALSAIGSGQVAYLPAGTYLIKSSIYIPSNKVLRGAGMGKTIIKGAATWSGWGLAGFNPNGAQKLGSSVNTGSLAKGSTTITTSSAHGLAVGDYVIIDQQDNAGGDPPVTAVGSNGTCTWCGRVTGRSAGQINKVTAVGSSTSFTVEIPLYWNYNSSLAPQVTKLTGLTVNAGMESLTVDNSVVQDGHGTLLWYAANCWFYGVETKFTAKEGMSVVGYRNTVRNSTLHDCSLPLGPSSGYGLRLETYASGNLIENNHIYRTSNPLLLDGQVSGNVIAYNWLEAHDQNTGRQNGAFSSHGAHPMMNLIEGNYMVGDFDIDFIWGSSSHYTLFRNRMMLQAPFTSYTNYKLLIDFREKQWYQNMIGNVLYNPSQAGVYEQTASPFDIAGTGSIYVLGYSSDGQNKRVDSSVAATMLRHGNYDYVLNTTQWNGSDDKVLPASLYLTSKPAFLGSAPWPPIGPDVAPMAPVAMPWPSGGSQPSAPTMLAVK